MSKRLLMKPAMFIEKENLRSVQRLCILKSNQVLSATMSKSRPNRMLNKQKFIYYFLDNIFIPAFFILRWHINVNWMYFGKDILSLTIGSTARKTASSRWLNHWIYIHLFPGEQSYYSGAFTDVDKVYCYSLNISLPPKFDLWFLFVELWSLFSFTLHFSFVSSKVFKEYHCTRMCYAIELVSNLSTRLFRWKGTHFHCWCHGSMQIFTIRINAHQTIMLNQIVSICINRFIAVGQLHIDFLIWLASMKDSFGIKRKFMK